MKLTLHILKAPKDRIKKIPWMLASRAFWIILLLIFLGLIWGLYFAYQYIFLIQTQNQPIIQGPVTFQLGGYKKVLQELDARQQGFNASSAKTFTNPFSAAAQESVATTAPQESATPSTLQNSHAPENSIIP